MPVGLLVNQCITANTCTLSDILETTHVQFTRCLSRYSADAAFIADNILYATPQTLIHSDQRYQSVQTARCATG